MCKRLVLGLIAATVCLAQTKSAPPPPEIHVSAEPWSPPPTTITTESNLVETDVVVRDRNGNVIPGLPRERFEILSDGKPQPLSFFNVITTPAHSAQPPKSTAPTQLAPSAQPRYLALLFDDVTTNVGDLGRARIAALRFIQEGFGPDDHIAVFTASGEQELSFTRDHAQLAAAIGALRRHPRQSTSLTVCPRITPYEADQITRYHSPLALQAVVAEAVNCGDGAMPMGVDEIKAIAQASWAQARGIAYDQLKVVDRAVAVLAQQRGERVIVFASGGFISDELGQLKGDMIQRALHANVVINALDAKGLFDPGAGRPINDPSDFAGHLPTVTFQFEEENRLPERQAQDEAMAELASATGGMFFHDNNDLALGFERLGLAPSVHYNLGFQPVALKHDGKFHRLRVRLQPPIPGALIQARQGYFAPTGQPTPASLDATVAQAMHSGAMDSAIPGQLVTRVITHGVTANLRLDASHLVFVKSDGRRKQQIVLTAALFDSSGRFVAGKRGFLDLDLTDPTWKRLQAQGLGANLTLDAPPGRYRLRLIVIESSSGALTTFSRPVTIR